MLVVAGEVEEENTRRPRTNRATDWDAHPLRLQGRGARLLLTLPENENPSLKHFSHDGKVAKEEIPVTFIEQDSSPISGSWLAIEECRIIRISTEPNY